LKQNKKAYSYIYLKIGRQQDLENLGPADIIKKRVILEKKKGD